MTEPLSHVWVQAWVIVRAEELDDDPTDQDCRRVAREDWCHGSNDEIDIDDDAKIIRVKGDEPHD